MATYAEILVASENATLNNQVRVAISVAADKIRTAASPPANQAKRLKWAAQAITNPDAITPVMVRVVLAQNRNLTLAQITSATDSAIQNAVDAGVDLFADLMV